MKAAQDLVDAGEAGRSPWAAFAFAALLAGALATAAVASLSSAKGAAPPLLDLWWGAVAIAGLVAIGAAARTSWRDAGLLAGALLVGSASQLGLTQPLWFEYLKLKPASPVGYVFYAGLAFQAAATAWVIATRGRGLGVRRLAGRLGIVRLAFFAALTLGCSVAVMHYLDPPAVARLAREVVLRGALMGLDLVTTLTFAAVVPTGSLARTGLHHLTGTHDAAEPAARLGRLIPWLAAAFVFVIAAIFSLVAFQGMPRIPDEVGYLFQARYLAAGHISLGAPPPALSEALQYDWIAMQGGRWFSIFPPGWPAALAVGVALGAPFLVNPALAALTVLVGHGLLKRIASVQTANIAALLLAASPWFLAMAASLSSHLLTVALVVGSWRLLASQGRWAILRNFIAGALMGWLFLTRPLDGLILGVILGLWALAQNDLRRIESWARLAPYALGCIVVASLIFPYNQALVGHPLLTPIDRYFNTLWGPGANRLGFGRDIGPPDRWNGLDLWRGHSPLEALINAQSSAVDLSTELFGWGLGSLALVFVQLIWGRIRALDLWMGGVVLAICIGYGFYWYTGGSYIGPRYWFVTIWPLVYLSARGAGTLVEVLGRAGVSEPRERTAATIALLGLIGVASFLTWRGATRYFELRDFSADYRSIAAAPEARGAVVFVRTKSAGDLGSALIENPLNLDPRRPLFVADRGAAANAAVLAVRPGARAIHVVGRSITGSPGARIVADGPARDATWRGGADR